MLVRMVDLSYFRFHESPEHAEVVSQGSLSSGLATIRFEEAVTEHLGVAQFISCNSGTSALYLAITALELEPRSYIAVPSLTFIATAAMVKAAGHIPVFIDTDMNGLIDVNSLEEACGKYKIAAVIPVHLYGNPADMQSIYDLSCQLGYYIIEDAAQAFGAMPNNRQLGEFSHMATLSFYASKNIPCGEGGGIILNPNHKKFARPITLTRNHGRVAHYDYEAIGFNYRLGDLYSSLGIHALKSAGDVLSKRRSNYKKYQETLKGKSEYIQHGTYGESSIHQMVVLSDRRDDLKSYLLEHKVETTIVYPRPLDSFPLFSDCPKFVQGNRSYTLAEKVLSLPVGPHVNTSDVTYICGLLANFEGALCES
jgi:dTDP-4-amino-4,6-dideoxygalactose transaminase